MALVKKNLGSPKNLYNMGFWGYPVIGKRKGIVKYRQITNVAQLTCGVSFDPEGPVSKRDLPSKPPKVNP